VAAGAEEHRHHMDPARAFGDEAGGGLREVGRDEIEASQAHAPARLQCADGRGHRPHRFGPLRIARAVREQDQRIGAAGRGRLRDGHR